MAFKFWIGVNGDWSDASNWAGGLPTAGDVDIDQSGVITASNVGIFGTVWLDYWSGAPSPVGLDLIGSSLGPGSYLLTNADGGPVEIVLHNSALQGSIFAGSGPTEMTVDSGSAAVNYGWIGVANATSLTSIGIHANGDFGNQGVIQSGTHGEFVLNFGQNTTTQQYVGNSGIIEADPGGSVIFQTTQTTSGTSSGTLVNFGQIKAAGGDVYVNADLLQAPSGTISITNGGTVELTGSADGGTIQIQSGVLTFGDLIPNSLAFAFPSTTVDFTGSDGSISLGDAGLSDVFNQATNSVELFAVNPATNKVQEVGDIHLGSALAYSSADFTTSNGSLVFHHTV